MADLHQLLLDSGAILQGHFLLASGRHSNVYFEKFRVLEKPEVLSALCTEIAEHYRYKSFDAVAGPTTGGIIIAFEVARQLGLPAIYVESENGKRTLRRGKTISPGARVLVVDDVLTTGGSLFQTRDAIEEAGGRVEAYGVLIDRSAPDFDARLPYFSSYQVAAESFPPDEVPAWLSALPLTKPGTTANLEPGRPVRN